MTSLVKQKKQQAGLSEEKPQMTVKVRRGKLLERLKFVSAWVWFFFILGFVINAVTWGVLIWKISPSTTSVLFLHYTIYFGVNSTGEWWKLALIPVSGTVLFFAHILTLGYSKTTQNMTLSMTIASFLCVLEAILFVAMIFLLKANSVL